MTIRKPNISARITAVLAASLAPLTAAAVLAVPASAGAAVLAVPASAAASPALAVSVSTSNTSATGQQLPFVAGTVYAITYTLTDNVPEQMTDVSFTDHLPTGLSVAPGSVSTESDCSDKSGSGPNTVPAQAGATSVSASGLIVAPGAGQGCEVELFVVAGTAEATASDTPGSASFQINGRSQTELNFASSAAPASAPVEFSAWNVSVIAPPTLAITYPATGAHFAFDRKVDVKLSGIAAVGDSLLPSNLYAINETNSDYTNGQQISTDIPGTHTLTVWAQTADGFIGSGQKISYTVGSPQPVKMVSHPLGSLSFDIKYLATGRATMTLRYGSTVIGYARQWVHVGKEMGVWMAPNAAAERIRASHRHGFKATLSIEYQVWDIHHFNNTPVNVVQNIKIS